MVRAAIIKRGIYWWVAPTSNQANITWELFHASIPRNLSDKRKLFEYHSSPERVITLINGSKLWWKSAEQQTLSGPGLDGLVMDEAAQIPEIIWTRDLRPALSDKLGWATLIFTPRGRNWVFKLFQEAKRLKGWACFQFPSHENPYLDRAELADMEARMPRLLYRQEILAEFLTDAAEVFNNIDLCMTEVLPLEPEANEFYIIGADIGKRKDSTVVYVLKQRTRVVAFVTRFQGSYSLQKQKIAEIAIKYNNAELWIDSTGVGDPICDDLLNAGLAVKPVMFTSESKRRMVESLAVCMEAVSIHLQKNDEVLRGALQDTICDYTPSGHLNYHASGSKSHLPDDVASLILANWGCGGAETFNPKGLVLGDPRLIQQRAIALPEQPFALPSDTFCEFATSDIERRKPKPDW